MALKKTIYKHSLTGRSPNIAIESPIPSTRFRANQRGAALGRKALKSITEEPLRKESRGSKPMGRR